MARDWWWWWGERGGKSTCFIEVLKSCCFDLSLRKPHFKSASLPLRTASPQPPSWSQKENKKKKKKKKGFLKNLSTYHTSGGSSRGTFPQCTKQAPNSKTGLEVVLNQPSTCDWQFPLLSAAASLQQNTK